MLESNYLSGNIKNVRQLSAIPELMHLEAKALSNLLILSRIRGYENGEMIIREGDMDQWLYFLLSGKVRILKGNITINILDQKGDIFGEMGLMDGLSRSADVYALGHSVCLAVDISAPDRPVSTEERADLLIRLGKVAAKYISTRLRLSNAELICAARGIVRLMKSHG